MSKKQLNKKLSEYYRIMFESEGPKHWWPAKTQFEVIVGAILTQFVSWANVTKAIINLKGKNLLNIEALCSVDNCCLEELIKCTRFYKQKARKLKEFCQHVNENYNGRLECFFEKDIYELRKELLSLYGIGEETADCIILYAANKPIFVVDAYTRRIFNRLGHFKEDISYREMQKFFMDNLENNVQIFNEFHAQIDGVGSNYCFNKSPDCVRCPLNAVCKSAGRVV